jgi:hypothetical protein
MSGKVKMRCARCGKPFKSSNARQTLCSECEAKERAARAAVKSAPKSAAVASAPVIAPKIVGPGAGILDPRLAVAAAAPAPAPAAAPSGARAQQPPRTGAERYGEPKATGRPASPTAPAGRPQEKRPPREPKKRTPKPATQPFELTDDLRAKVEARYLELAQPVEYDGIRSKIATELSVPKAAVKKAVLDLRKRMQMPSWWELQAYTGAPEELERIRAAYMPHLPVPPVGIHKQIAADLELDASAVYQGIRRIRAELRLPQYNPPDLHESPEAPAAATVAQPSGETGAEA